MQRTKFISHQNLCKTIEKMAKNMEIQKKNFLFNKNLEKAIEVVAI